MAYPAAAIANEFLDLAGRSERKLTQIEIQKLVYFAHGWHLALKDQELFPEQIEAWKYGPVVRKLYDAFKKFGNSQITQKALDWTIGPQGKVAYCYPSIQSPSVENDAVARTVVQSVWSKYGLLPAFRLVEITHLPGSPWEQALANGNSFIPNDGIKAYFKGILSKGQR
jgi:uncharacterized phage-associated protein